MELDFCFCTGTVSACMSSGIQETIQYILQYNAPVNVIPCLPSKGRPKGI